MHNITATLINLYHICKRELWLHSNEIRMEHTSDTVTEGKLIGENTYLQRSDRYRELVMDGIKIDYYDAKHKIVHETKKSDKMEAAHVAQVKYYIWKLEQNGISDATGIIEYPKLRHTQQVVLDDGDRIMIPKWESEIIKIITDEKIPKVIHKPICKNCSYFDFCYAE
jgi:CRISPR-associated exonuclease Cas4